jgi:hypothetical protein
MRKREGKKEGGGKETYVQAKFLIQELFSIIDAI